MDFAAVCRIPYLYSQIPCSVFLTDQSCFTTLRIANIYNELAWSDENPHALQWHHQQRQFSSNLRDRISRNRLTDPDIFLSLHTTEQLVVEWGNW
jgi:hypothetical protein